MSDDFERDHDPSFFTVQDAASLKDRRLNAHRITRPEGRRSKPG